MPQVPQYQRKIGEADAPAVRVSGGYTPDMFGAGIGKSISQVSDALQVQADKMDKAAVIQAENQLRQKTTEYLYGNLFKREGAAAAGVDKDFEKQYQTMMGETRKGLSGRAQQAFDVISTQYKTSLYPHIQGHMSKQADVALDEAHKGQREMDAVAISMPGAWRDQNTVATMLTKGEVATKVMFDRRNPVWVTAKIAERNNYVLAAGAKAIRDRGDYSELKEYLDRYGKLMDPRDEAPLRGWERQKTEHAAISVEADRIAAQFGDNLAGAEAYIRGLKGQGGGKVDESIVKFSSGDNPDWQGVSQSTRAGTAKVFGLLSSMGLQGEITSGKRNNNDSSWHNVGGGADVWLADKDGNRLAADDARVKQVMAEAKKAGWEEVLYHDAGSGIHLHLGNYTGSASGGGRDPEYYDKLRNSVFAAVQKNKAIKHDIELRIRENLDDSLAQTNDRSARLQLIRESGLRPGDVRRLESKEINDRESDITMEMKLKALDDKGLLTPNDVNAAADLLSGKSYRAWMLKSVDSGSSRVKTEEEKRRKEIDAEIGVRVEKELAGKKDEERAIAKNSIYADLNEKGLKGEARLAEARKLIAAEKSTTGIVYSNFTGRRDQLNDLKTRYPDKAGIITWVANSTGALGAGDFEPFIAGIDLKDPEVSQALKNMQRDGAQLTPRNLEYALDAVRARKTWSRGEKYTPRSPITPEPAAESRTNYNSVLGDTD